MSTAEKQPCVAAWILIICIILELLEVFRSVLPVSVEFSWLQVEKIECTVT